MQKKVRNKWQGRFVEPLEQRCLLSTATTTTVSETATASVMGQNVTFKALISPADQSAGTPTGTVTFMDGTNTLGTANVNTNGKAHLDVYNLYKGTHTITADYTPTGTFTATASNSVDLAVTRGNVNFRANQLGVATVVPGSGPGAAFGVNGLVVNYTGYLVDGTEFDSSLNPGRTPFKFNLEKPGGSGEDAEEVIMGWDKGLLGVEAGETRLLIIPSTLGYGPSGQGSIPADAKLFFIIQVLKVRAAFPPELVVQSPTSEQLTNAEPASSANGDVFSDTPVGQTSVLTFTYSQGTSVPLSITNATVNGANASEFTLGSGSESGQFTITFAPTQDGLQKATINIFSNDTVNPDFKIKVQGTGD